LSGNDDLFLCIEKPARKSTGAFTIVEQRQFLIGFVEKKNNIKVTTPTKAQAKGACLLYCYRAVACRPSR
jgi:hypothetical protein